MATNADDNSGPATQCQLEERGVCLVFDGFKFPSRLINGDAMKALTTPIPEIEPGPVTIYFNALDLLSKALHVKLTSPPQSQVEFKSAVDRAWGLASVNSTFFLVRHFTAARTRFRAKLKNKNHVYVRNGGKNLANDSLLFKKSLNDILEQARRPPEEIPTGPLAPRDNMVFPIQPAEYHTPISSAELAKNIYEVLIAQGPVGHENTQELIIAVLEASTKLGTRIVLHEMMNEAQNGSSGIQMNQFLCREICRQFHVAIESACTDGIDKAMPQLSGCLGLFEEWRPRLDLSPNPEEAATWQGVPGKNEQDKNVLVDEEDEEVKIILAHRPRQEDRQP
ncbi:uncharacterized protein F4822DRAFT_441681 [Hypoxylon trugodes]|uniref:uncharacterized protein n=1 Tax=Hypoxylon trugodes TaxID=326681 RepID=UPI002193CDFA|nr:uncharacterized protein F4822DRAFT_441681 [Hypoxylon trugodes]KAI1392936.1 hypothetical protein F4822DRAFT_441681 [Hypoxylon trugodes]